MPRHSVGELGRRLGLKHALVRLIALVIVKRPPVLPRQNGIRSIARDPQNVLVVLFMVDVPSAAVPLHHGVLVGAVATRDL